MKRRSTVSALLVLFIFCTFGAAAQPLRVDFRQAANDDSPLSTGEVHWTQAILQQNNSVYYEGMSVPQRIMLMNIPATNGNVHKLTFRHKAGKGGKHAYDFLTSYAQAKSAANAIVGPTVLFDLNECGATIGPPKSMQQACEDIRGGQFSLSVDAPDNMSTLLSHSVASKVTSYESRFGNRVIDLYGDGSISNASLTFDGYTTGSNPDALYTLTWTSSASSILIEMAAHLALGTDVAGAGTGIGYGAGYGAGSISGGSYHFRLDELDGKALGSQDNQIMGATVLQSITCSSTGPDPVCINTQNTYSFNSTAGGLTYTWSLSNNTSNASIVGSVTGSSVVVDAGNQPGEYTITVIVRDGLQTVMCPTTVQVQGFTVTAAALPLQCAGGTTPVTVTANGGKAPFSGLGTFLKPAGTHTFTVTDGNGCTNTATVTIAEPQTLQASATATVILCPNGTSEVTVTAQGGKPPYQGIGKFLRGAGKHNFTVKDANDCLTIASVNIVEPSAMIITHQVTPITCGGGSATVTISATGGTPPYTGTGTFTRTAGTYNFTVTDANGCSGTHTVTVTQPAPITPIANVTTPILCYGGDATVEVTVTGGTPPYSGTGTFNLKAGTHTITVTDANNCSGTTTLTLTEPSTALAIAVSGSTQISCYGGKSSITVSASGGTPPYSGTGSFDLAAGTHTLTVTDANGCTESTSVTLTQPSAALTASASVTQQILCNGGNATIEVTATGGTAPYSGTGTFNYGAGTYSFTVTDANGCTAMTQALTVTAPQSLAVTASVTSAILCYGGTGTVTVSASGGTAPYTGTGTFNKTAGTHTFTVTDANGCSGSATVTLTQPSSALSIAVSGSTQISCNGGTAAIDVTASGGTPPYSGIGTFNLAAGTHTLTVTDANGCTESATITVTQPASGLNVSAAITSQINCYGGNATVQVSATGGTAPYTGTGTFSKPAGTYTFTVTDANGCSAATALTITQPSAALAVTASVTSAINCYGGTGTVQVSATGGTAPYTGTGTFNKTAGTHTFTVTDANGCTASATATLTQPAAALSIVVSGSTQISCYGGTASITVSASGGTAPYTGTGTFNMTAGTHTFTVTDANGCSASASITLTQPAAALAVTATATPILCNGGQSTVTVSATGGSAPYTGTGTFSKGAGAYTFTVTDANGCSASASVTIQQPTKLIAAATVQTPIFCHGGDGTIKVTAYGGKAPFTGTGTFSRKAGTHTFTVTDANGCTETVTVTLTQPSSALSISVSGSTQLSCYGSSANLTVTASGGTPPYTGTGTFSKSAGTHTITVTDANGCTASTTITVTEPPELVVTANVSPILCYGGTATIDVSASGGTPPYNGVTSYTHGPGTYTFTVTDANGCTASKTVTITEPPLLAASVTALPIACNGGTTTVTVAATGGTSPYTGTGSFTVGAGTYTYIVTDANGCADTVAITLTEPRVLIAASSATPILCYGGQSAVTVTASGGTAPYTGTGTFIRGAGSYTFTVTDANGCTATTSVTITQPPQLTITASASNLACGRDSTLVTVTASGGTSPYTGTGSFYRGLGTHTFTVTDANGCQATTSVTITGPPPLYAAANATPILCFGGTSDITVSGWGGTPPYSGVGTFTRNAGTHTFVVTDANNCSDTVEVTIIEPPELVADADAPPIACNGGTTDVTVTASGGTPPYTGVGKFSRGAGTHWFVVTDANGCTDSVSVTLHDPPVLSVSATATPILCHGDLSTVTVTATGGTPPYSGTGTFLKLAGTHAFVVTDARGCQAMTMITITEPPELAAVANTPSVVCGRDSAEIQIRATGGTPPYSGTGNFWRLPGTYTFVVTDANGCTDTVQATVSGPPPVYATAAATPILCHGGMTDITVTAYGGTPPYSGIGTFTYGAGTHTFIVTDANGCTDTVTIHVPEPPPLSVVCTVSDCINGMRTVTAHVTGGTPPYFYSWSPMMSTMPSVDVPCNWSGIISLMVRDANWTSSDPNNAACEATCSVQIMSKENAAGDPGSAMTDGGYVLYENYPNPFNPSTTIKYFVPEASHVRLTVINTLGKTVQTLVDEEVSAGMHHATWNGLSQYGDRVASGSYIYRIHATSRVSDREFVKERLMLLLK